MNEPFLGHSGLCNLLHYFSVQDQQEGNRRFPNWHGFSFKCDRPNPKEFFLCMLENAEGAVHADRETIVGQCEVVPGLALFIEFSWRNNFLIQCSAQAVVVPNGTMSELLSEQPPRALYYRFDFSIEERGNLFDHPFPHVHSYFDGAPRFPFCFPGTKFPLFRWLEFLMINHYYFLWVNWAKDQCADSHTVGIRTADRDPSAFFDAFPQINKWNTIPSNERDGFVRAAKLTLQAATDAAAAGFPTVPDDFLKLNYWSH